MDKLKAALTLAAKGFHVFPVKADNKIPAVDRWQDAASNSPSKVKEFFDGSEQNIGISTSKFADDEYLLVVDVDTKKADGFKSLELLQTIHGALPQTFGVNTPSGGMHLYFKSNKQVSNSANKIGAGIDIRGTGGYVVAPFSSIGGKLYEAVHKCPIAPAPEWLVDVAGQPRERDDREDVDGELLDLPGAINRATDFLMNDCPYAVEGMGGDEDTYKAACAVMDFGLSPSMALDLMLEHWNPLCSPPWNPEDLEVKVNNAAAYRKTAIGDKLPQADFEPLTEEEKEEHVTEPKRLRLKYTLAEIVAPRLEKHYLIEDVIGLGAASTLYGPPNAGKTFAILDMAFHLAMGWEWAGKRVVRSSVLYVALEGGFGIYNRVAALKQHYKVREDIPLGIVTADVDLRTGRRDANDLVSLCKQLREETGWSTGLIVIDTLARAMAGGDENSAKDMGEVVKTMDFIRAKVGCHVMAIHHTGKDKARGARGSNSLLGAIDTEIFIDGADNKGYISFKKQRDMEKGAAISYALKRIVLGQDQDGVDVTSCVLIKSEASAAEDFVDEKLNKKQRAVWNAVKDALYGDGEIGTAGLYDALDRVRDAHGLTDAKAAKSRQKAYRGFMEQLEDKNYVFKDGDVWKPYEHVNLEEDE